MKNVKKFLSVLLVVLIAFSATATTVFAAEKATSLKLNATTIKWAVGKSGSFKPTILPAGASKTLSWSSSNPTVATVSSAGKLTAKSVGTATITCKTTDGSKLSATCKVTVGKAVTSVKLNATTIKWPVGKAGSFKPTVSPADAINKNLTWTSSNPSVATVSSAGKLTAVSAGTTTITCKAADGSGKYATCKVTVTGSGKLATSLKLNATTIKWAVGKSGSFKPTVLPEGASKTLSWTSSNPTVATVSSAGKLTAKSAGTATITCKTTDGSNLKATCKVTVTDSSIRVTSVKLNTSKLTWVNGRSGSFKPTVSPENATNKALVWTSSNTSVATVSSSGKLTTIKPGKTTITCKAADGSGKYATCEVTVVKAVSSITLNKTSSNLVKGKTLTLKATVNPSDAYNKGVTWASSNTSVATVDSSGKVTAKASGTATITCKAKDGSGKSATCVITVGTIIKSISIPKSIVWEAGKSGSFKPTITPSDAVNKTLTWKSLNPAVATVDANGKLIAKKAGTATITCQTTDGSNKIAYCRVLVTDSENPCTNYEKYFKNYFSDGEYTIEGMISTDGKVFDSTIKFGVFGEKMNNSVGIVQDGMPLEVVSNEEGTFAVITLTEEMLDEIAGEVGGVLDMFLKGGGIYYKMSDDGTTSSRVFSNYVYKGSSQKSVSGKTYNAEIFTTYTEDNELVTVSYYFDDAGTLKYINEDLEDGSSLLIKITGVSAKYTASDFKVPDGYINFNIGNLGK